MNLLAAAALLLLPKAQDEATYHFGTDPARTNISFSGKTSVTNILGVTNTISGTATIDFAKGNGSCHLVVPADTLKTGIGDLDHAMKGKMWLNAAEFKTIEFKAESASRDGKTWKIPGKFTFHGVTRDLEIEAKVLPLPAALAEKFKLGKGKWIKVAVGFQVDIVAHGIEIDKTPYANVNKIWDVKVDLYGTTEPPAGAVSPAVPEEDDPFNVVRPRKVSKEGLEGTLCRFGTKQQHTTIIAVSETEAGKVMAKSTLVAGYAGVDLAKGTGHVRLSVPVKSLKTGIGARDKLLHGPTMLDAAKHPDLDFESTKAVRKADATWTVEGNLKLHGVTKPLSLEVDVQELSEEEMRKAKWGKQPGLRFKAGFKVKLSDFGVTVPDAGIGDEWTMTVDLLALMDSK